MDQTGLSPVLLGLLAVLAVLGALAFGGKIKFGPVLEVSVNGALQAWRSAAQAKGAKPPDEGTLKTLVTTLGAHLPTASILWVDDQPLNNLYERRAFAELGVFCDPYTSNADGLAAMTKVRYDLVISDIGRGDARETGWDLLTSVRLQQPPLPLIFYTYGPDQETIERARREGAEGITTSPDELIRTVLTTLKRHKGK
jgi:CheY-like chemotaxis protein